MNFVLKIWRQKNAEDKGQFVAYPIKDVSPDASFLEMLDMLNRDLILKKEDAVAFDHDCREGICGMCSIVINGRPHGKEKGTTACQLHMRKFKDFKDGSTIYIEPWRARAFPVVRDLVVDRTALDRLITAGGYVSVRTGSAPEANSILVPKPDAELAMDAAACIGCGACVAACKNSAAMLFVAAKISHMALLPQGRAEARERVHKMAEAMKKEGFGNCTNEEKCVEVCPKQIKMKNITRMNWEFLKASLG
jgi:succinate dehydrogenase / fumarate reductase iron-sulfur subunit